MSSDEIRLRKAGEPEFNSLPRGVQVVRLHGKVVFVRKIGHRLMPVSMEEQKRLTEKHVS